MTLFDSPENIEIGRRFVVARSLPDGMADRLRISAYYRQQRQRAAWLGCCGHGERETVNGRCVCLHTRQPCRKHALAELVAFWQWGESEIILEENTVEDNTGAGTSLITADIRRDMVAMSQTVNAAALELAEARQAGDMMAAAIVTACGIQALREQFTPALLAQVMPLMNTKLGFDTDKNPKKNHVGPLYDEETVRDVLIEGALEGARFTHNEINIMSGGLYLTVNYWERSFCELPEVSGVMPPALDSPREDKRGDKTYAVVHAKLEYMVNGQRRTTDCTGASSIRVIWNRGMSVEAIHGKVRKRLYKRAYQEVTGWAVDESGDEDVVEGQVVSQVVGEEVPKQDASREAQRAGEGTGGASGTQAAGRQTSPPTSTQGKPPEAHEITAEYLGRAEIELAEAEGIRQCDAIANDYLDKMLDDTSRQLLAIMVDKRKTEIRANRGERAK